MKCGEIYFLSPQGQDRSLLCVQNVEKQRKHQRACAIAYENMGKWTITNPGCSYTYLKDNKPVRFSQGTTGIRIQTQWYHLISPADFESSSGNGVQRLTTLVMEPRIG